MNHPPVIIMMTTWAPEGIVGEMRALSAKIALESWSKNLEYAGEIRLHVADDGSTYESYGRGLLNPPCSWWEGLATFSRQERRGVGASLNVGFKAAFAISPLAVYFVDDWRLPCLFNLTPWAELLLQDDSVGMVRFGPPHPHLTGGMRMYPSGWGLLLDRHHFVYGFRPAMYHQRFFEAYGGFDEGLNAFECEKLYNERFCKSEGPSIVYALPYPWEHVGRIEVGDVVP